MNRHAKLALKYWSAIEAGQKVRWRGAARGAIDFSRSEWNVLTPPVFRDDTDYEMEVIPRTITVNGIEVPEPRRVALQLGQQYYLANPFVAAGYENMGLFTGADFDRNEWIRFGLVHDTIEAAAAHGKAMRATSEVKP